MTKKILRRLLIFAVLVVLLIAYLSMVFTFPRKQQSDMVRERFNSFYALPDDTVDAVFIGTSGIDRYLIPQLAYKEDGITCYGLASGNQPLVFVKYMMEEALKTQDVKTFIVELRGVTKDPATINDTDVRRVTDNLRLSSTKYRATREVLEFLGSGETKIDTEDSSYYFSLAKYHAGWKDLTFTDFINLFPTSAHMGFFANNEDAFYIEEQPETKITDETAPIDERNEAALVDLLDYCDTLDCEVIFTVSPHSPRVSKQKKLNYAIELVESRGYKTVNFNTADMYDELDWDFSKDQYNRGHANIYGAVKFTRWWADYLMEDCCLEDRRDDENGNSYETWENAYENTMNRLKQFDEEYYNEIYIAD